MKSQSPQITRESPDHIKSLDQGVLKEVNLGSGHNSHKGSRLATAQTNVTHSTIIPQARVIATAYHYAHNPLPLDDRNLRLSYQTYSSADNYANVHNANTYQNSTLMPSKVHSADPFDKYETINPREQIRIINENPNSIQPAYNFYNKSQININTNSNNFYNTNQNFTNYMNSNPSQYTNQGDKAARYMLEVEKRIGERSTNFL